MPQVSNLFYSTDTEKVTLHSRIKPSKEQRSEQKERWRDLKAFLKDDLSGKLNLPTSSWLQGSYKMGTQIRPVGRRSEFDIDLGIYFEWKGDPNDAAHSAEEVKDLVYESVAEYASSEDEAELREPKEKCARVAFPGNFHIDIPCYFEDSDRNTMKLATSNGWEDSNPVAFYDWFRSLFNEEKSKQVRRLVRYFKVWSQYKLEEAPSSILLTVLVAEAYQNLQEEALSSDDLAFGSAAVQILNRLRNNSKVSNPARGAEENLNRLSGTGLNLFLEELENLIEATNRALLAESELDAVSIWTDVFGTFFPSASDEAVQSSRSLVLFNANPEVYVEVKDKNNQLKVKGINGVRSVPLDSMIYFSITNSGTIPQNARVRWIVRNEGREAELENDLGHFSGPSGRDFDVVEHSEYVGNHFMDIEIISSEGRVIGYRRVPVNIVGNVRLRRNPPKPYWVRFRNKKR